MEPLRAASFAKRDRTILAIVGLVLIVSTGLFAWSDRKHDWRYYQAEFVRMVAEKFGAAKASALPTGTQQIWVPDLQRADRCITCHQAVSWPGFETAEEPFRTHPKDILRNHPVSRFGCTSCHGGQGYAVDPQEAHGPIEHWEEPVLGRQLGESYTLALPPSSLMQMNCNVCHRYDRSTPGADAINLAKSLVTEKGCRACHVINGRGGTIGPDLTNVGDKPAEQYDFSHLSGQQTAYAWHVGHLKDPRALVQDTVMPNFHFSTKEAQALATLILSWRREPVPASFLSGAPRTEPQTPEEKEAEAKMRTGPGAWFVKTGCFVCHSISVYGVKSPAQIGPDLSVAVEDVQARFGRTIDDFIAAPTGTMSVVLSRQIILSPEEKQVAVQKLREAFAEHQRQKSAGTSTAKADH
ncbi:MAG TPA: c-type cytochrome [Myxococcaceae bacterium]|nr:c-type cytochrome [Myxococcaceae bacterium]